MCFTHSSHQERVCFVLKSSVFLVACLKRARWLHASFTQLTHESSCTCGLGSLCSWRMPRSGVQIVCRLHKETPRPARKPLRMVFSVVTLQSLRFCDSSHPRTHHAYELNNQRDHCCFFTRLTDTQRDGLQHHFGDPWCQFTAEDRSHHTDRADRNALPDFWRGGHRTR